MKKSIVWIITLLLVLVAIYFAGPDPETPVYNLDLPTVPEEPAQLERYVLLNESKHKIKPGNEAEIVWFDTAKRKTDYAVLYLHGFTASKMEGDPTHRKFASDFGCNMFLARLSDHGVDTTETLLLYTPERAWQSAKQALAIAKKLGNKIIIMSTSTGSTLALKLAAEYPNDIFALISFSPNVALKDPAAFLLNNPWGFHIAKFILGSEYRVTNADEKKARYWNKSQRIESLTQLEELIETTMTQETFSRIHQPSLSLYYYRSETEQDTEVSVDALLKMHEQIATPPAMKRAVSIPGASSHVLASSLTSGDLEGVYTEVVKFTEEVLKISRVQSEQAI